MPKFIKISTLKYEDADNKPVCVPVCKYVLINARYFVSAVPLYGECDDERKKHSAAESTIGLALGSGYTEFLSDETVKQIEEKIRRPLWTKIKRCLRLIKMWISK
jgi:hypothetical protein